MKPIIGVAGYYMTKIDNHLLDFEINQAPKSLTTALQNAGALPVIIPLSDPEEAKNYVDKVDAIVLAGGADVDPLLYGEEPSLKIGKIEPRRDVFEMALVKEAWAQKKAILGTCRGLQLLNIVFGGTLYQDLSYYDGLEINHIQPTYWDFPTHSIEIDAQSLIGKSLGTAAVINSYHHQAVKDLADVFKPVAWSKDRIIEAFESIDPEQKTIAVQWHPETLIENNPESQNIFEAFVHLLTD